MSEALGVTDRLSPKRQAADPRGLRVALFSGNYNYVVDGPARALNRLVRHLEERGHSALIFAPTTRAPALKHAGTLISVPSVSLPGSRSEYRFSLGLPGSAKAQLDAFRPSIVHLSAPDMLGVAALNYAAHHGVPAVASFHTRFDTYPRYYRARWAEKHVLSYLRWFYARCAQVYPPSQSMADELGAAGIGSDLRLWERGVDSALFKPARRDPSLRRRLGFTPDDVVVLFVGRLVLEKGIDVFAEAIALAARSNAKIRALIVGEGPERARFAARLPAGAFAGFLEGEALAAAYASADIFLNPSITETFGQVTLEAMASGLPAVCAAAPGSLSLIVDRVSGVLCAREEGPQGYADQLLKLAGDPERRRRYGAAARARALRYDWTEILDGLIENYLNAIASTGR